MSEASPGATFHHMQQTLGRTPSRLCSQGRGREGVVVKGRTDTRLAHWLPGKPAETPPPLSPPSINYHSGDVLI